MAWESAKSVRRAAPKNQRSRKIAQMPGTMEVIRCSKEFVRAVASGLEREEDRR